MFPGKQGYLCHTNLQIRLGHCQVADKQPGESEAMQDSSGEKLLFID